MNHILGVDYVTEAAAWFGCLAWLVLPDTSRARMAVRRADLDKRIKWWPPGSYG